MIAQVKSLLYNVVKSTVTGIQGGTINLTDIFQDKTAQELDDLKDYLVKYDIKVTWADPRDPSQMPCIAILRNDDGEIKENIGDDMDSEDNGDSVYEYFGQPVLGDYSLNIWATNSEMREYLYQIAWYSLFINRKYLETKGLQLQRLSGGDQEGVQSPYFPDFIYLARIGFNNRMDLVMPVKYNKITNVTLGSVDLYSTNFVRNWRLQTWNKGNGPFTAAGETASYWYMTLSSGTSMSVIKSSDQIYAEPYSLKCTLTNTKGIVYQDIYNGALLQGKLVNVYCWLYSTVAGKIKISVDDGATITESSYHGGTGWEKVRVSHTVARMITRLRLSIYNTAATTTALEFYIGEIVLN